MTETKKGSLKKNEDLFQLFVLDFDFKVFVVGLIFGIVEGYIGTGVTTCVYGIFDKLGL